MQKQYNQFRDVVVSQYLEQKDIRGSFSRIYPDTSGSGTDNLLPFTSIILSKNLVKGTLRGLHLQLKPYEEVKLITCIKGRLYDVFVDLRINSETFMDWASIELSDENRNVLILPKGFAHGYQTLDDNSEIIYAIQGEYSLNNSRTIYHADPSLNIKWPLDISLLSDGDCAGVTIESILNEIDSI